MVSEGQKNEANYSMILYNNSFLYFMNDYKKKNVETGLESHQCLKEGHIPFNSATV